MKRWHPVFSADEREPGVWTMVTSLGQEYGEIALRRTEAGPRYRVIVHGKLLGWATTLKLATERANFAYVSSLGHQGPANAPR